MATRLLPKELEALTELALDLRLAGSQFVARIFSALDPEGWERTNNPHMVLMNAHQDRLEEAARDQGLVGELKTWLERWEDYHARDAWFDKNHTSRDLKGVAYFSMEFGLSEGLPIYSGGLGILAGDHLKSASDLGVPLYGIGLLYQQGYFRQVLSKDGWQLEAYPFNDPASLPVTPVLDADGRWPRVRLELPGRTLLLRVWQAKVGKIMLYLLDSNHPLNSPWDRGITAQLYSAGKEKRLLQELVLGIGGWRLLEKLGIDVEVCHLNEGHAAFAVLARAASFAQKAKVPFRTALRATRAGNVFTTHTPVEAAFDQFDSAILSEYAQPFVESAGLTMEEFLSLGRRDAKNHHEPFNMAYLAMRGACHVNGVSRLHREVSQELFRPLFHGWPTREVPVGSVTNGVHVPTWDSAPANALWSSTFKQPGKWLDHLEDAAEGIRELPNSAIWDFRAEARMTLIRYVRRRLSRQIRERGASDVEIACAEHILDPNVLTLGFARRFTAYKRPNLMLTDPERFARLLRNGDRPVQIVIAGKAHPNDDHGKSMVQAIARFTNREDVRGRMVFLEDYDMVLAQHFAAGVDVWLNNPVRPAEACGTSGMKMLVNGGLNLSILDGWWDEAYTPEVGWALGDGKNHGPERDATESGHLYDLLEQTVIPEFYHRGRDGVPHSWVARVRSSMCQLTAPFSSDRMVRQYVEQCYLPAAEAYRKRAAEGGALAHQLETWHEELAAGWRGVRIGEVRIREANDHWNFELQVYLGEVPRNGVNVQLFAEPRACDEKLPTVVTMQLESPLPGAVNGFLFVASVPNTRPAAHYTPRVVSRHCDAYIPIEESHILWRS